MEKDYEKLFAVKYVLQKEGLEKFRRNCKHITESENAGRSGTDHRAR
jgi:hypothetical protein